MLTHPNLRKDDEKIRQERRHQHLLSAHVPYARGINTLRLFQGHSGTGSWGGRREAAGKEIGCSGLLWELFAVLVIVDCLARSEFLSFFVVDCVERNYGSCLPFSL